MYPGFPRPLLALLRCTRDGGPLTLASSEPPDAPARNGALCCAACGGRYPVEDGVARLLDPERLSAESRNERAQRDQLGVTDDTAWEDSEWSRMDSEPTVEALELEPHMLLLELGSGGGRFTVRLGNAGARVLAVDFSAAGLRKLARRIDPAWQIGLVQADCTRLAVEPGRFDRVLSTLVSNLPSSQERSAMFRVAAVALKPTGRLVFSTHHHSLLDRLRRMPQAGHYPENGIFRYLFRCGEARAEACAHFRRVRCWPIQIAFPLARRLGLSPVAVSRYAERVPGINQFGQLLLAVATHPIVVAAQETLGV